MKVVLISKLPVQRAALFVEMAWLERRPELGLLCAAALKNGRRITADTVRSTLPGVQDAGASNIVSWCRSLDLCDAQGALTDLGVRVASDGMAPVPEQGVYDLWLVDHPVVGRRVLAAERMTSTRDQRAEAITQLPIEPELKREFASVIEPQKRFLVRSLPSRRTRAEGIALPTRAECRFRWTLDFDNARDHWQLEGKIEPGKGSEEAMRPFRHSPESVGLDLWGLAATWGADPLSSFGRWRESESERHLAVSFQGLTSAEADSFRKTVRLQRVEVTGMGTYEDVTLEDVPIAPAGEGDAQRWAMSRFDRRLASSPTFRTRADVRALFSELTEGTPLERHAPTLPAHAELLAQASKTPEVFWSIAAPVDLAPTPPDARELGPFRLGEVTEAARLASGDRLRLTRSEGWPMKRLVDLLVGETRPRRMLLCDRYVRGEDNLASLRLFVDCLRGVTPMPILDVWTDGESADLKRVQAITGTTPRTYREVFGRSALHDRYVLIQPAEGRAFGWQLSNSPLDARSNTPPATTTTPLRWRDLSGVRVEVNELDLALRQWFEGGRR